MAEFGSKGMTGTALGLSIGALGTQLLNGNLNGLLGGLLGNGNNNAATEMAMAAMLAGAANTGRGCGDHPRRSGNRSPHYEPLPHLRRAGRSA